MTKKPDFADLQRIGAAVAFYDEDGESTVTKVEDDRVYVEGPLFTGWLTRQDFEEYACDDSGNLLKAEAEEDEEPKPWPFGGPIGGLYP